MPLSTAEFWRLAIDSGLLSAQDTIALSDSFGRVKGAGRTQHAKTLAQWLVGQNVLSEYQVRVLLTGHTGKFIFGDYKVYDRVSSGRFTGWFRAIHSTTQYPVLLEFVEPRIIADFARWHRAQSLSRQIASVESPPVLQLWELVDLDYHKFFVFDDARGQTVAEALSQQGRMPAARACRFAREAAESLAALHAAGVVHGRVRAENILLLESDRALVIADPLAAAEPLAIGGIQGTDDPLAAANYAAPELAGPGTPPSQLTDVYALGATLYQMLSGDVPFAGGDVAQKLARHATERIKQLDQTVGVPLPLAQIVAYAMAKNASLRYADATALAAALKPFAAASASAASDSRRADFSAAIAERRRSFLSSAPTLERGSYSPVSSARQAAQSVMRAVPAIQAPVVSAAVAKEPASVPASAIPIARPVLAEQPTGESKPPEDRHAKLVAAARRRQITNWSVIAASLLLMAALAGYFLSRGVDDTALEPNGKNTADKNKEEKTPAIVEDTAPAAEAGRQGTVPDDGHTLWASPTAGKPIQLKYVSSGAHAYLHARPQSLLSTSDGRRTFDALGPLAAWLQERVEQSAGVPLAEIDQLTLAMHGTQSGSPEISLVVEVREPRSKWLDDLGDTTPAEHAGETYYERGAWSYWFPKDKANRVLVATPKGAMQAILDERGRAVVLNRLEMRKLLAATDRRQHMTLLAEPNFLFSDGRELFADHAAKLLDPLRAYISRDMNGALLSVFVNDYDFYMELRLAPGSQKNAYTIQQEFNDRLATLGDDVEEYVVSLNPQQYARMLVRRLPEMTRELVRYTRTGVQNAQFVARTYLPAPAGHNIVLAGELALAETPGQGGGTSIGPSKPATLAEQLQLPLTLVFDQMAFGAVVDELMEQSGAKIVVLGKDLEADGITRNKEIRDFSMDKKSLHEMLVLLCMKNNPVPGITAASDPNQKLVYAVGPSPDDGTDVILITTRKAAAAKKYKLPSAFGG
jgi:serine/threonine protein kinase